MRSVEDVPMWPGLMTTEPGRSDDHDTPAGLRPDAGGTTRPPGPDPATVEPSEPTAFAVRALLREAFRVVPADAGVVALVVGRSLVRLASSGFRPRAFASWPLPLAGTGPVVDAVTRRQSVWIASSDELRDRHPDLEASGTSAGAFIPIVDGSRTIGVLGLTFSGGHTWTDGERRALERVASLLTPPLCRLDTAERRRTVAARLEHLHIEPSGQARLDRAARLAADGLGGDMVVIGLLSADGVWLDRFAVHHPDPGAEVELRTLVADRVRVGEHPASRMLLDGRSLLVPEIDPAEYAADVVPRFAPFFEQWPVHATAAVPLGLAPDQADERGPVGILTSMRLRAGDPYRDSDRRWLEELAPHIARLAPAPVPATAAVPADDAGTQRFVPLAGRPAGWAAAALAPVAVGAAAAALSGSGWVTAGAAFVAAIAAIAAVAGRLQQAARHALRRERQQAERRHQETAERLATIEAQAQADSRYRSLVEATTAVTWRVDVNGHLVEPQPAWEAYTGQPWTEQAGRGWVAMVHPDDQTMVESAWREMLTSGEGAFLTRLRLWSAAAGEYRSVMAHAVPLRDGRGEIVEWIGTITDVHEQVHAQERADRAAALLDTLTRQAPVGLAYLDTAGRYHMVNDQLALIDGRPEGEHEGRRPEEVSPTAAAITPLVDSVLGSGEPVLDVNLKTGDDAPGGARELVASAYPVRDPDGGMLGVGTTVVEVTEHNRLTRELDESRARLAALVEANVLAVMFGENDRITHANDAFLSMTGHRRADLEAGRLTWTGLTADGWEETDREALERLAREGRVDAYEKEYLDADGRPVPIEIGAVAIEREPLRWTAYVVDLRERKAVEQRLRDAYDQRDHVARTLQTSLLPPSLPQPDGLRFAARYLPSPLGEGVGGDFYDVYPAHAGDWHVAIGDVCGRGTDAAALTALARYALRTAAIDAEDPADILRVLNDAVRGAVDDGRFCTVSYTVLSRRARGLAGQHRWQATVTLGGHHPLRILRRGDGTGGTPEVLTVGKPGTLIGVFPTAELTSVVVDLEPDDIVVGFTDGLIEQHQPPFDEGDLDDLLDRLVRAGADLDTVVAAIEAHVAPEAVRDDDTAILAFQVDGSTD
jgi:PAS domain S-box-containing protein